MDDFDAQEMAQLGLKKIEDAIVGLLTRHPEGLATDAIVGELGLGSGLPAGKRNLIATAVLELLTHAGRIVWDGGRKVYLDNPDKG